MLLLAMTPECSLELYTTGWDGSSAVFTDEELSPVKMAALA